MGMPEELYYKLNNVTANIRNYERDACKLEAEANEIREKSWKEIQELYDMLDAATITLSPKIKLDK